MWKEQHLTVADKSAFRQNLNELCRDFDPFCVLDSCDFYTKERMQLPLPYYHDYDLLAGLGAIEKLTPQQGHSFSALENFAGKNCWKFGFLTYDLKNETENLHSENFDGIEAPPMFFFIPQIVILLKGNKATLISLDETLMTETGRKLSNSPSGNGSSSTSNTLTRRMDKDTYVKKARRLIDHIARGDIYEINFCQENYAEDAEINPYHTFSMIQQEAPAPFATFMRSGDIYIMSATMERFLKNKSGKLISQPIKGTIKRGINSTDDKKLAATLKNDPKERAENVMIVDLVRNDLSRNAQPGTVSVEELFGIYPFPQVHQMISTVSALHDPAVSAIQALKDAFPMGSMTGAPKLMAMDLIEKYEMTKRGIFSGSAGYIDPTGNFDFNVIIRTILYNQANKYLSLQVGSAITFDASPEKEWEECELKIRKLSQFC